jgi:hypothetical protein
MIITPGLNNPRTQNPAYKSAPNPLFFYCSLLSLRERARVRAIGSHQSKKLLFNTRVIIVGNRMSNSPKDFPPHATIYL